MDLAFTRALFFDASQAQLALARGEVVLRRAKQVEDVKGNPEELGTLTLTNLRLTWMHRRERMVNFMIGLGAVTAMDPGSDGGPEAHRRLLTVKAKRGGSRYVFILRTALRDNAELFADCKQVYRDFQASKLYHSVAINEFLGEGKLVPLQEEVLVSRYECVAFLSGRTQGTLHLTSFRAVFLARQSELTISASWATVTGVHRSGSLLSLSIEGVEYLFEPSGDPLEEMQKLREAFLARPVLGIFRLGEQAGLADFDPAELAEQSVLLNSNVQKMAAYRTEHFETKKVVFNWELGLAMEELPAGIVLADLWEVMK
jgi:Bardet-Biedl syndrome 5 protein